MGEGAIAEVDQANLTEQQQAQVDEFVTKGYHLIYDEEEAVANAASRDPDTKVENVAMAGFLVGQKIDRSMEQAGRPPYPDEVKAVGGYHLVDKIIEFAEHKGTPPFSPEEKKAALQETFQKYMSHGIKNRTIDPIALANQAEKAQPGSVRDAMAKVPDNVSTDRVTPGQSTQGQPGQGQAPGQPAGGAPQGLLTQPSPLEGFLNGRLG